VFLHMGKYEYKTYVCPNKDCAEFMTTSELREHIIQYHENNSNLPYWSDSSSSSQSPPPIDSFDPLNDNNSWDEWFHNALDQSKPQFGGRENDECLEFLANTVAQDPSQTMMTSNENLSPPRHSPSSPSFDLEVFNTQSSNQSASNFLAALTHGSILGPVEDNYISHASNFNYIEPLDNLSLPQISPRQEPLPAFSDSSINIAPNFSSMQGPLIMDRTRPMTRFSRTELPYKSSMNDLGISLGAVSNNTSQLNFPSSHNQSKMRLSLVPLLPSGSNNFYSTQDSQDRGEVARKTRNETSIQDRQPFRKMHIQGESMSTFGDIYGASDLESNLPKKRRRSGLQDSRTDSREYRSVTQSFLEVGPSQEISIGPSPQNKPREAPGFPCQTCPRTYKTEGDLS
jgi:hypothetical protein